MKQLIPTVALLLLCFFPAYSQNYETIDIIDWSTFIDQSISGSSQSGQIWTAQGIDCDSNGFFGADPSNEVFRIEDTEGACGCNCISNDPNPLCGQNDNVLNVTLLGTPLTHCQTRIRFTIEANGVKCGQNDQYTTTAPGCPADDSYLGTDMLSFLVVGDDFPEGQISMICGMNGAGEYIIDLGSSIFTQIQFTGGTQQAGEYYTISNILFEGVRTSLPPTLNATVLTADADGQICENNLPIILQTIADPSFDYQWIGPDNFFSFEYSPVIQDITPANSGTYFVTVTDPNGCQAEHQVDVEVLPATDAKCTASPTFANLNVSVCSNLVLPSISDNGITGTWSPGANLSPFAGQTLEFTFTPDDENIVEYSQVLLVDDVSLLETFGSQPDPVPIFCNTVAATYDFIDIFELNLDMQLQINGENEIFSFILPGEFLNDHINELTNLSFGGVTPGVKDFFIEAISPCGEVATKTFQFIVSSDVDPLMIDTVLCEGDFLEIGGEIFDINNPYGFVDDGFCDSSIVVSLSFIPIGRNNNPLVFSGSCGGDIYYFYDTIVNNEYVGFVGGKISNPPHGPDYLDIFTESFNGNYTMPITAANGCDSIQRLIISLVEAEFDTIAFDLCSNLDTFVNVEGLGAVVVNAANPFHIVGDCDITVIDANIVQVQADTVQMVFCADQDTIIDGILFDKDHPQEMIFYEKGPNGCSASKFVDLEFLEPSYGYVNERICIGEFVVAGGQIFTQDAIDEEVYLSRGAEGGCDSIIIVNIDVVEPTSEQIEMTICKEDEFVFLGETYNVNRTFGFPRVKSVLGCDSILYSVNLTFYDSDDVLLDPVLCYGESMTFNEFGITINENFLQGEVDFTTSDGCTQKIIVDAIMRPLNSTDVMLDLCSGGSLEINGTTYDENNISGTEIFAAANGCDSVVNVLMNILPVKESDLSFSICTGGEIAYNGTIYNASNPSGTEFFTTTVGCDSLVNVSLVFDPIKESDLNVSICQGGEFFFNGTIYDETNLTGVESFTTSDGCDSLVNVFISVDPVKESDLNVSICQGGEFFFNGTIYDESNLTGVESFTTSDGCDSLVNVFISVDPVKESDLNVSICQGGEFFFNGTIYDESNLTGVESFTTSDGCDSLVNVFISVDPIKESDLNVSICQGGEFFFNGTIYDETNLTGVESFTTSDGCDSLVNVFISVDPVKESDLNVSICQGGEFFFNGTIYDESNLTGVESFTTSDGCDSLVNVFISVDPVKESDLNVSICQGGEFIFNGTVYDETNLTGVESFTTFEGCDSLVNVSLTVDPVIESDLIFEICEGSEIIFNGTVYDESNLSGIEAFSTAEGCDSLVNVTVIVHPDKQTELIMELCAGESFEHNGITYDEDNPSGQASLLTSEGCDSIVNITLNFHIPEIVNVDTTICPDGFIRVGGEIFRGDVTAEFAIPSSLGCDSIIYMIDLELYEITPVTLDPVLCDGDTYTDPVFGITIDENNLNDNVIAINEFGCSQPVIIAATMLAENIVDYQPQICRGESVTINGTLYNESNPSGSTTLTSVFGCDSTVNVQVQFTDQILYDITQSLCPGEEIVVNGVTYNESNAQGSESLTSVNGCDSMVTVNLSYYQEYSTLIDDLMCHDDFIIVNGVTYDVNNPNGIELLYSVFGCDSTVTIDLTFSPVLIESYDNAICEDESMDIHGITYSAAITTDTRTIVGANGCDSIVYTVDLTILEIEEEFITGVLCEDESQTINGVVYDVNNPVGTEVFTGGAANGCDRLVHVDFTFELTDITDFTTTLCPGESITLGGQVFDENFPIGSVVLQSVNGCDSIVDVTVNFYDISLNIGGVIGSCEGVANGSFVIDNVSGATPPFNLAGLPGGPITFDALPFTITGLSAGSYNFQIVDNNGCSVNGSVDIENDRSSNLNIEVTTIDPLGQFQLNVTSSTEIGRIEWAVDPGLNCIDCANPEVNISETTTFEVTVFDPDGCAASTTITVFIDEVGNIYVPNVINLNSFSGNNMFYVQGENGVEAFADICIFDRWGNKVWEASEMPINVKEYGWNGRFNDKIVSSGVYVYHVIVRIANGAQIEMGGDLTILK